MVIVLLSSIATSLRSRLDSLMPVADRSRSSQCIAYFTACAGSANERTRGQSLCFIVFIVAYSFSFRNWRCVLYHRLPPQHLLQRHLGVGLLLPLLLHDVSPPLVALQQRVEHRPLRYLHLRPHSSPTQRNKCVNLVPLLVWLSVHRISCLAFAS